MLSFICEVTHFFWIDKYLSLFFINIIQLSTESKIKLKALIIFHLYGLDVDSNYVNRYLNDNTHLG